MARFALNLRTWSALVFLLFITISLLVLNHSSNFATEISFSSSSLSSITAHGDIIQHIDNATLGFQKIYVISLPSRTDHRDALDLAASYTGLNLTFVDAATNLSTKAWPNGAKEGQLRQPEWGNWRSHMNIARTMIEEHVQSALILEDDADWDIRIKLLMKDFARGARTLIQPVSAPPDEEYLDPTFPRPSFDSIWTDLYPGQNQTRTPLTSPYGDLDRWDLLWLGHCGCRFPRASDINMPLGRAIILNDTSVPAQRHLDMEFGNQELLQYYPPHTRVVHHAAVNTCTLGYALSLPGAMRMLYELSVHEFGGTTDMAIRAFCNGRDTTNSTCLTVQPQLFEHHRPVGSRASMSDISDHTGEGDNLHAYTPNIRWSTRVNLPVLANGSTDYIDLYDDLAARRSIPIH